ncbi:GNAT family N-acetyltransferase [Marinobacterium sediminicola]|uniref:Acetyltransferase (GNAT) family protein n=1 Tax=Marinobacterium sediminicola TaxID=518898 RepID=A0ABY1RWI9_9GAMM|nr:GNAT family N-acetyltransferase [Marinobacterium sediminicola]ULG70322.1 GNAT family N-acetyltransferase [Marinobacterium sediminicola]SMR69725.1 Acetyltransferase (GNAT) family protein [Marinobacterium sediminicola]
MDIEVVQADYTHPDHARDIPLLLNEYAKDPMGGGCALAEEVQQALVSKLAKIPHAFSILAYVNGEPAGLVNCFEAFSTFACKPIINIHDVVVLGHYRGAGLSQKMLALVEDIARERGCCKVTLEVLSKNEVAKSAYRKFGFSGYELDPETGVALFWEKKL